MKPDVLDTVDLSSQMSQLMYHVCSTYTGSYISIVAAQEAPHYRLYMPNSSNSSLAMALSARSGIEYIDPSYVPLVVKTKVTEQYFQVATLTVLVFDASRYFIARILMDVDIQSSHHLRQGGASLYSQPCENN